MQEIHHAATIESEAQSFKKFKKKWCPNMHLTQDPGKTTGKPDPVLRLSTGNKKDRLYNQYYGKP
jgi:hypothetical protein